MEWPTTMRRLSAYHVFFMSLKIKYINMCNVHAMCIYDMGSNIKLNKTNIVCVYINSHLANATDEYFDRVILI